MRCHHATALAIDRPAEANANRLDPLRLEQGGDESGELLQDSRATTGAVHRKPNKLADLAAGVRDTQLQFRPADFDAEKHY